MNTLQFKSATNVGSLRIAGISRKYHHPVKETTPTLFIMFMDTKGQMWKRLSQI